MSLPDGWPATTDSETLPNVFLSLPEYRGAPGTSASAVASWTVERELVGSTLPGNVRARSGLSIGSASASIAQTTGLPLAPWGRGDRKVTTGGLAFLYAEHPDAPGVQLALGDWIVDPASGALTSPAVNIQLVERQYMGRTQDNLLPAAYGDCDPAWMIDTLARQIGYYSTPPAVPSAVMSAPLQGGAWPERGLLSALAPDLAYDRATGPIGFAGDGTPGRLLTYQYDSNVILNRVDQSAYLTMNATGTVQVRFGVNYQGLIPTCDLEVHTATGVLAVRAAPGAPWVTVPYVGGDDDVHPYRVQVEVQRLGTPGDEGDTWSGFRARARSSATSDWSSWASSTAANTSPSTFQVTLVPAAGGGVSGVQVTTATDMALWDPNINADIDLFGGTIIAPWLPGDVDVWSGIQQVCSATLGAAWLTRDRLFVARGRSYLAGATSIGEPFDIGRLAADLDWTIDPGDTADRLEVTYAPADVEEGFYAYGIPDPIAWQAEDVIEVPPFSTVDVVAELEFFANLYSATAAWVPAWETDLLDTGSIYSIYTNRGGAGTHAVESAITISQREVSAGRVIISLRNNTAQSLYTVDANGEPCLFLRCFRRVRQETTATATRGLSEAEATNPISIDLGRFVQTRDDAESIASFIWTRVSNPAWKASSVRVRLDWGHDIGRILSLVHQRSGLAVKALVTKVSYDGRAGEVAQSLDLVLLNPTWGDFDAAWAGTTWGDFDAAWSALSWDDFDDTPLSTTP